jgi:hypothetical protein
MLAEDAAALGKRIWHGICNDLGMAGSTGR